MLMHAARGFLLRERLLLDDAFFFFPHAAKLFLSPCGGFLPHVRDSLPFPLSIPTEDVR